MGDAIQKQILSYISQCKYFSILTDETTDVSQTEQLRLSVRFIKDTKVHEEFLCFVPVSPTTGKDLASTILTQLSELGLNLEHMRGQGYDGASNMSGKYRGVQARVKELYSLHRRIQDFFRGGLKDDFIRMCTDCIAVKTQLLR